MAAPDPASPSVTEEPAHSYVVLVVEDEVLIRMAIADHLRDTGLKVYEAGNALEAVDLLSHYGHEIDVVFSDIMMPGTMSGLGLVDWVDQNHPSIPVVLTSGVPDLSQKVVDLRHAGMFFLKPYDMDKVAHLITTKAQARAQTRDATQAP